MSELPEIIPMLSEVNFLSKLDHETLELLKNKLRFETYQSGVILCREGESGDRMFVVASGCIEVIKQSAEGVFVVITELQAGQIAGEMSLLADMNRTATLTAKEESGVWVLDRTDFQQLLETHASMGKALLASLSEHLSRETGVVARLLSRDLDPRPKMAFFDSKPYMKAPFDDANENRYNIRYYEARLSVNTASLAAGCQVACVFVNDNVNGPVVRELAAMGVELIALRCAGYNNVDLDACKDVGISVVRVPAYSPYAVAEHAIALMLALNRKTSKANNRVREGNFSLAGLVGFDMHGRTAGVIGIGKIGKCTASILAGFGCRVIGYARSKDTDFAASIGMEYVELDDLFAQSDIISFHAPLSPETHHMVNKESIEKMKDGVMLINTSRGALVDTVALIDGLKSGKIGYAGLDVYEEEGDYFFEDLSGEVMKDDVLARLTTFNNVMVTSHQAFLTDEALSAIATTTFQNIDEFCAGKRADELTNNVLVS